MFGLNIVAPSQGRTRRAKAGSPDAKWMAAQFGPRGGPGSIWRIDRTGRVSLFANVAYQGAPNSGPGLGNIAFDPVSKHLFVSDLETGMIHRFAPNRAEVGTYDPARAAGRGRALPGGVRSGAPRRHRQSRLQRRGPVDLGLCGAGAAGVRPRRIWRPAVLCGGRAADLVGRHQSQRQLRRRRAQRDQHHGAEPRRGHRHHLQPRRHDVSEPARAGRGELRLHRHGQAEDRGRAGLSQAGGRKPRDLGAGRRNTRSASRRPTATPTAAWRSATATTSAG